ncbi:Si-specific NAD(P)(+) transhydrogenase [Acetobacter tropicalis]|uniref:Soluble pyridine nucleotide transhydrogenase n=2 Tax=Acetobacter TaxID=434 RepID=A0A0U5F0F4_9PROT|nr:MULTISPECIES: Si-specific NAD(P)(+) transhydrogenase [Acetobacter]MCG4253281.1 Si-specific NAD(P)(+) transhydrogenase [Acetobacter senegalensis]MCG4259548.1 Si-specific NAD(P)(+) transhydrogenase [Acetobacter senegalensis]MDN7354749.1 Si-specific NAD(P)(+) transhydrogenase [Acetobacter senegalensis]CEF42231.1 NAD(P) transhydrogenase [Acetobacter senegalensis]GAA08974.1 dihydrolipoamide dehydrogenase [Acetobacter tropicalis NBRC 101654]
MNKAYAYDLIVIGSGPSGRRAAVQASKFGKAVLVIERHQKIGGVSVHTGTIPSKTLRETVLNLTGWRERGIYGFSYRVKHHIDAQDLGRRLDKTLSDKIDVLEHQFSRNGIDVAYGVARFVDPHTIEIVGEQGRSRQVSGKAIVIAVGSVPHRPDHIPFDGKYVIDSDAMVCLEHIPRSLVVIGGGVIGIEYATIFSALDVRVTIVDQRDQILDFVDREIVQDFVQQLRDRGVNFRLGCTLESIVIEDDQPVALLEGGRRVRGELLLYTGGRQGATADLNLAAAGLSADGRGRLKVDANSFQTEVPHIYATGDVIGFPALASTSMEQGRIAACHACGYAVPPAPAFFPYGIYSVPEISTVGLTEEDVQKKKMPYETGIARFRETSRGQIMGETAGFLKIIVCLETHRLLGVHIVGEAATELIHIGQAVLNFGGSFEYFIEATFNYPTFAEAYKIAALDVWNRMTPRQDGEPPAVAPETLAPERAAKTD